MTLEIWLAFVLASAVMLAIPGPTILLVIGYGLQHGMRAALPVVLGVALGDLTAMTFSLAGLGALLATSASLFTVLKVAGALYLVYLGIRMWRADPVLPQAEAKAVPVMGRRMARQAFIVTALNPKSIVFFIAFLPQFIDHGSAVTPQLVTLGATFLVIAVVNAWIYAVMAGRARSRIEDLRILRWANRVGGSLLIGAGLLTAGLRRAS
jgi:threonine/homoserine/homoserine lactone efflux protein